MNGLQVSYGILLLLMAGLVYSCVIISDRPDEEEFTDPEE